MQMPKLARRAMSGLVCIGLSVWLIGCGSLPFGQPTRPAQTAAPTVAPKAVATETPAVTATPVVPSTPVVPQPTVPPTLAPTLTPAPLPNLSAVKLTPKDLPAGFVEASADNLKKMNLTEDALNVAFGKLGAQARVQHLAALQHPQRAQLVVSFLVYPLTSAEKAALETQLGNMENVLKAWGSALVGEAGVKNAKPLAGADKFGDKSAGLTTTMLMLGVNIRAEAVMSARGSVVQVVMSFYPEAVPPAINTVDLAKLADTRLATTLTGK